MQVIFSSPQWNILKASLKWRDTNGTICYYSTAEWRLLGDSVRPRQTLPGRASFPQWWLSELERSQWMFTFVSQADFYFILCCSSWPLGSTKAVAQKLWSLGVSKSYKNNVSYCITVRWCYGDCCSPSLQPHFSVSVNTSNVGFLPPLCFFFFL